MNISKIVFWILAGCTSVFSIFYLFLWIGIPASHELSALAKVCGKYGFFLLIPASLLTWGIYFKRFQVVGTSTKGTLLEQGFWFCVLGAALIGTVYGFLFYQSYSWRLFLI